MCFPVYRKDRIFLRKSNKKPQKNCVSDKKILKVIQVSKNHLDKELNRHSSLGSKTKHNHILINVCNQNVI